MNAWLNTLSHELFISEFQLSIHNSNSVYPNYQVIKQQIKWIYLMLRGHRLQFLDLNNKETLQKWKPCSARSRNINCNLFPEPHKRLIYNLWASMCMYKHWQNNITRNYHNATSHELGVNHITTILYPRIIIDSFMHSHAQLNKQWSNEAKPIFTFTAHNYPHLRYMAFVFNIKKINCFHHLKRMQIFKEHLLLKKAFASN